MFIRLATGHKIPPTSSLCVEILMNGVVWLSKQFYQPELGHFCFKDEALHFTTTFGLEFCEHFFLREVRHLRKL